MKKYLLFISFPVLFSGWYLLTSFGGDENADYPGGSPAGYTGSPYDAKDCHDCHGGTTAPVTDWITSDIPAGGYTPGDPYTITVTVPGTGRKGFEVSPHDLNGNLLGTLTAGAGSKLVGSGKYITQSSGSYANPAVWSFTWTAPAAGTGEVTFWGAFAVGEFNTKTASLVVQENTAVPLAATATADPLHLPIGDSTHLGVIVSGGSGNYTYSWSSNPPGFTSDLPDPWAVPAETTTYIIEVSDGTDTVTDSIEVTVYGVGTEEVEPGTVLTLSPNPVVSHLDLAVSGLTTPDPEVMVIPLTGIQLVRMPLPAFRDSGRIRLDLGHLPAGMYLLVIQDGGKKISRKFVKTD